MAVTVCPRQRARVASFVERANELNHVEIALPGPTGERNTLAFTPRGPVLLAEHGVLRRMADLSRFTVSALLETGGEVVQVRPTPAAGANPRQALDAWVESFNKHDAAAREKWLRGDATSYSEDRKKAGLMGEAWHEWTAQTAFWPFTRGLANPGAFALIGGTLLFLVATWLPARRAARVEWVVLDTNDRHVVPAELTSAGHLDSTAPAEECWRRITT